MATHSIPPVGVKLDPTIKLRLEKLAKIKDRAIHWLMKEAIRQYTEREEAAERLKQETLARWEQEAMRHKTVGHEAMITWLDSWGTNHETRRPLCEK